MPSKNGNAPTWDANISRTFPLPEKFKCAVGGEWKPSAQFSKKQLSVWYRNKRSPNDGVTAANIQIVCRDHSGEPPILLKCAGPCGQWKARDKFSTSQKRNNLRWCVSCVRWRLEQDHDSIPVAAPNEANDAADEREGFTAVEEGINFYSEDDFELEGNSSFPDIDDDASCGTDKEDEGGPCPPATGHGHFFEDSDPDDDDIVAASIDSVTNLSKPLSTMTISTSQPKNSQPAKPNSYSKQAKHHAANIRSSHLASTYPKPLEARNSPVVQSLQSSSWIPPHLRKSENLVTLHEKNLTECHIPGYNKSIPATGMGNTSVLPHLRAAAPQQSEAPIQLPTASKSLISKLKSSGTSASTITNDPEVPTKSPAANYYSFAPGVSTQSQVSDDSRAGVPTMSTSSRTYSTVGNGRQNPRAMQNRQFNAYDPQGNAHRRTVEGNNTQTSLAPSFSAQRNADRNKPTSSTWARPDRRKVFNTVTLENKRSGKDHVHVYDSGSEDEM